MKAFWDGMLAGYAIAVPVGAIAVLILDLAMRRGLAAGLAAGAGAATVDFLFASLAGLAGQVLAPLLAPVGPGLRVVSGGVLIGLGAWGLWRLTHATPAAARPPTVTGSGGVGPVYGQFVGLTLLNPMTIAYFAALILGQNAGALTTWTERAVFVAGVGLASLSWQTLLAVLGAWAHRRLSPRVQWWTSVIGNGIVIVFGLRFFLPG